MDIVKSLDLTVMSAIHDLNIAAMYCDRLIAIRSGQVVGMGTPRELLTPDFIHNLYDVECGVQYFDNGRINIVYIPKHWAKHKSAETGYCKVSRFCVKKAKRLNFHYISFFQK